MIQIVPDLYEKHIKGTEKGALVQPVQAFLCNLTSAVIKGISSPCKKVHINTRVLKHTYDKRTAEEFYFLITSVHLVVKYPDVIFKNKSGKRGEFCFVKEINNQKCLCSLEIIEKENATFFEIATFFRTDDSYLKNYELLWEWKGGDLHRSAFDSELLRPNDTLQ